MPSGPGRLVDDERSFWGGELALGPLYSSIASLIGFETTSFPETERITCAMRWGGMKLPKHKVGLASATPTLADSSSTSPATDTGDVGRGRETHLAPVIFRRPSKPKQMGYAWWYKVCQYATINAASPIRPWGMIPASDNSTRSPLFTPVPSPSPQLLSASCSPPL